MPYRQRLNSAQTISRSDAYNLQKEFDLLRAELDDLRTKYAATLAKLDLDATVTDTNYAALGALAASQFTAV